MMDDQSSGDRRVLPEQVREAYESLKRLWKNFVTILDEDYAGFEVIPPDEYVQSWITYDAVDYKEFLQSMRGMDPILREHIGVRLGFAQVDTEKLNTLEELAFTPVSGIDQQSVDGYIGDFLVDQGDKKDVPEILPAFQILGLEGKPVSYKDGLSKIVSYLTGQNNYSVSSIRFYFKIPREVSEGSPDQSRVFELLSWPHLKYSHASLGGNLINPDIRQRRGDHVWADLEREEEDARAPAVQRRFEEYETASDGRYVMVGIDFARKNIHGQKREYRTMLIPNAEGLVVAGALQPDVINYVVRGK